MSKVNLIDNARSSPHRRPVRPARAAMFVALAGCIGCRADAAVIDPSGAGQVAIGAPATPAPTPASTPTPAPTPTPTPVPIGRRAGLAWASGAYVSGGATGGYDEFAEWRGRALDVAVVWGDRAEWADLVDAWIYAEWADRPEILAIGIPPYPEAVGGSLAACAAGDYDDEWVAIGTALRDAGISTRTIVRLGWEFNGDWYAWSAHDPAEFAECWRRVVGAAEAEAPELRWEWTVSAGVGASVADAAEAWPGADWVDVVGLTKYDRWPQACDPASWEANHAAAEFGLDHWLGFARARDRPLAVSEWAPFDGGDNAGSACPDNAAYVDHMYAWFDEHAADLAYEAYFGIVADDMRSALHEPGGLEAASTAYRSRFGSGS